MPTLTLAHTTRQAKRATTTAAKALRTSDEKVTEVDSVGGKADGAMDRMVGALMGVKAASWTDLGETSHPKPHVATLLTRCAIDI